MTVVRAITANFEKISALKGPMNVELAFLDMMSNSMSATYSLCTPHLPLCPCQLEQDVRNGAIRKTCFGIHRKFRHCN